MSIEGNTSKPQRGGSALRRSAMCIASGNLPRFLVFLFSEAPAGRHVYRRATCPSNPSPSGATGEPGGTKIGT